MEHATEMKLLYVLLSLVLATGNMLAQQNNDERIIDLKPFGFHGGSCNGRAFFLDDDRLVLSVPLMKTCGKNTWWTAKATQFTVIDLHGKVITTKDRSDVVETHEGPLGYASLCTENSIELISGELNTKLSIPEKEYPCFRIGSVSPSRTAINIAGQLFQGSSAKPIAEAGNSKGSRIVGITDSGYAICAAIGYLTCSHFTVNGVEWKGDPSWEQYMQHALFLSQEELLLQNYSGGKYLESVTFYGLKTQIADLTKFRPRHTNSDSISLSAIAPRRILYSVTGCFLGDFDDCYGVSYRKFVVFDSQTHKPIFHHDMDGNSAPIISPNGHVVIDVDETDLHIYSIP